MNECSFGLLTCLLPCPPARLAWLGLLICFTVSTPLGSCSGIYLSICHPYSFFFLLVSTYLLYLSIYPSIHPSIHLSPQNLLPCSLALRLGFCPALVSHLSILLWFSLYFIFILISFFNFVPACSILPVSFINSSVHLSVSLSICQSVNLSIYLSVSEQAK